MLFGCKCVQNLRIEIYPKNFWPKWSFVKSIPGDEALELLEFSLVGGELNDSVPLDPVPAKHA
jgi:hypothetical protein